jgi:hypothetical protein
LQLAVGEHLYDGGEPERARSAVAHAQKLAVDDLRLRFIAATDQISWAENFNVLLKAALGEYLVFMSHDDLYPAGFIQELVACLEAEPDVLNAYPRCVLVDADYQPRAYQPDPELLLRPGEQWSARVALRQLIFRESIAIKGMFRLKSIVNAGLYLRSALDTVLADVCWVFALGLLGRPRFVPSTRVLKCVGPTSASAPWKVEWRHVWSAHVVLCSYIRDFAPDLRSAAEAMAVVSAWSTARVAAFAPESWPMRCAPRTGSQAAGSSAVSAGPTVRSALSAQFGACKKPPPGETTCYGCRHQLIWPRATTCCGAMQLR